MKQVAAAIILQDHKVLITQRSRTGDLPLKWEFPGGKIELGETPQDCLIRELHEELEVNASVQDFFMRTTYAYDFGIIELSFYFATIESGEIKLNVHEASAWVKLSALNMYDFAPADVDVVKALVHLQGGY